MPDFSSLFWDILTDATLSFPHFLWVFTIFHCCIFNGRTMGLKNSKSPKWRDRSETCLVVFLRRKKLISIWVVLLGVRHTLFLSLCLHFNQNFHTFTKFSYSIWFAIESIDIYKTEKKSNKFRKVSKITFTFVPLEQTSQKFTGCVFPWRHRTAVTMQIHWYVNHSNIFVI